MSSAASLPPLIAPNPDTIPLQLRQAKRWAPWRAEWNPRKAKWTKIPHRANRPEHGLSNKNQTGWTTFEHAMAVYKANPDKFAGVGYLMTGRHGVTGVDLDHCVTDGKIDDWAQEVAAKFDSYTEISPSGTGLHIMVAGDVPEDWTNHDRGIEVYGGNEARFLCVTGQQVPGSPADMRPPRDGALDHIEKRYKKARSKAEVEDLHLPDLLPAELLPDLNDLGLPPHARNFLSEGPGPGDRSQQLFSTAIALNQAGLAPDEVLSVLEANEHAMELALEHRRQDYDKALRYLWKHSAQQGAARADEFKRLALDEFEDYEPLTESCPGVDSPPRSTDPIDDFEVLGGAVPPANRDFAPIKAPRFTPVSPSAFLKRKPASWIVKGIVPRAGLAVIYGASGSGKTFLTLDMTAAVVRGEPWRGAAVKKGRAVYVVAEGAAGFRNRLEAYCLFHGVDPGDFDVGVVADAPNLLAKEDVRDLLKAIIAFGKVDMVVIDTYARAMAGGNENDAKDVGQAVAHCDLIHRKTGALVVLVHHSGKDATKGARGSGALRAAADLEIEVVQTRDYRAATVTKQKDGEDGKEFAFKLAEVVIGEDEDGEPITSCVVEHKDGPAPRPAPVLKGNPAAVFSALQALMDLAGEVTYADALDACAAALPHEEGKRDRRRDTATVAIQALESKGLVRLENGKLYLQ